MDQHYLGIQDCERLQLLSTYYYTTNIDQHGGKINEHTKQDKSKTNKNLKINLESGNKITQEVAYFIVGPDKRADMESTEKKLHSDYNDSFTGSTFPYTSRKE